MFTDTETFQPLLKAQEKQIKKEHIENSSSDQIETSDGEELNNVPMKQRKRMLIKSSSSEVISIGHSIKDNIL